MCNTEFFFKIVEFLGVMTKSNIAFVSDFIQNSRNSILQLLDILFSDGLSLFYFT